GSRPDQSAARQCAHPRALATGNAPDSTGQNRGARSLLLGLTAGSRATPGRLAVRCQPGGCSPVSSEPASKSGGPQRGGRSATRRHAGAAASELVPGGRERRAATVIGVSGGSDRCVAGDFGAGAASAVRLECCFAVSQAAGRAGAARGNP